MASQASPIARLALNALLYHRSVTLEIALDHVVEPESDLSAEQPLPLTWLVPLWHHGESTIGSPASLTAGEKLVVAPRNDIVRCKIVDEPSVVGIMDDSLRIER